MAKDDSTLLESVRAMIALSTKEAKDAIAEHNRLLKRPLDDARTLNPADATSGRRDGSAK
jgi:arsenate reductase-like glutaredoxin family protein